MSYYNNQMALWEPLLEPNERELLSGETEPQLWELNFEMAVDKDKDETEGTSTTKMKISSNSILEITLTKMCLEVLQNLSKAFSEAIKPGITKIEPEAPYVVTNDTGNIQTYILFECLIG